MPPAQKPGTHVVGSSIVFCCCCTVLCCALRVGPDDDRKAKLAWRQEKAAEEKRLAQEK